MNVEQTILEIATLPIDVRLRLVSAIWDTLPQDADLSPSSLQQAELDRRIAEHRKDPGSAISHEEIMLRVKSRTPSETLSLRWDDIDWERNRMNIPEPKVEHHEGRGFADARSFQNCDRSSTKP